MTRAQNIHTAEIFGYTVCTTVNKLWGTGYRPLFQGLLPLIPEMFAKEWLVEGNGRLSFSIMG